MSIQRLPSVPDIQFINTFPASMASENKHRLHFVMVPLMSPGHFIPMIDMAKLLAQRGVTATVITTPLIASRFSPIISRSIESGLPIQLLQLRFPTAEAGLPEGCETLDTLPSMEFVGNFLTAMGMLQQPLEQLVEKLRPCPNCIIADRYLPWVANTARKFHIPRIMFDGMSCFTHLCWNNLHISKVHERVPNSSELFLVPDLPDRIEFTKAQLPEELNPRSDGVKYFAEQIRKTAEEAYGVVINSFEELEPRYIKQYREARGGKAWFVGPVSLCNRENSDKAQRGNKPAIDESQCLKWLDAQKRGSVIYACLGSITGLSAPQLAELGLGLEASKHPFIWVIRGGEKSKEIEEWMEEDRFEERTIGRGLVIRGWAPQVLILSHLSVGAFLTHCGWNSTLEGVCAGLPMITWPIFGEQFFNEKLVVEVLGIGVGVGAWVSSPWGEEAKVGVLVERKSVTEAVGKVMDEGIEAEERRNRAKVLREMGKKAMEEGGSSYLNLTFLIEDIMQQVTQKRSAKEH